MNKAKEIVVGMAMLSIMFTVCIVLDIADRGKRDAEYS